MKFCSIIKIFALPAIMLASTLPGSAADEARLAVRQTDSGDVVQVFPLNDNVRLTFDSPGYMNVNDADGETGKVKLADDIRLTFESGVTSVGMIADTDRISMLYDRGLQTIAFTGYDAEAPLTVCDSNGKILLNTIYKPGDKVSLAETGSGVCLVTLGSHSFKLIK